MIRPGVRRFLRVVLRRPATAREQVAEELRLHVELRVEQLLREGYGAEAARLEAVRRLGGLARARGRMEKSAMRRDFGMIGRDWFSDLGRDFGYALRGVRREPAFAAMVMVTLALGIGANAAMFGVVDRLMLRGPEHVVDADRVQRVYLTYQVAPEPPITDATVGYVEYATLRERTRSFSALAAYSASEVQLERGATATLIQAGYATPDFFPLLGVQPVLGRFHDSSEDRAPRGQNVAVLSYGLWQRLYAGSRDALGKTVLLADQSYTIIGVAPQGFTGAELAPINVWLPMSLRGFGMTDDWSTSWSVQWLHVIGRLKPGITSEQAALDATAAHRAGYTGDEEYVGKGTLSLAPLLYTRGGNEPAEAAVSRWLAGVALIVLLIACANVGNLLLARTLRRRREVAVRLVLGITRARLSRLLLVETMVLTLGGALLGLLVAYWGGAFIRAALLPQVEWTKSPVNGRVLLFTFAAALATGLLVGLLPIAQSMRSSLAGWLRTGTREGGGRRSATRLVLTVSQSALSVILLIGAGLFVRSLLNVQGLHLGIEPERVIVVSPRFPSMAALSEDARTIERARRMAVLDAILERLHAVPGVEQASSAVGLPFKNQFSIRLRVPGLDSVPRLSTGGPRIAAVNPGYFGTVGTKLLRGRAFEGSDRPDSEPVAMVNQTMAKTIWPGEDPIGKCLMLGKEPTGCARIVGLVEDARRQQLREEPAMQFYIPIGQETAFGFGGRVLLIRPRGDAGVLLPQVRDIALRADPAVGFVDVGMLQDEIDPQLRPWRLGASMFVAFGGLALLIAAIGLYSVMAYLVGNRTQELGVRLALGARPAGLMAMVLRQSLVMALAGVALGISAALVAGPAVQPLLFETSARDPRVYLTVAAALTLTALLASALPARRATRVDPISALRAD